MVTFIPKAGISCAILTLLSFNITNISTNHLLLHRHLVFTDVGCFLDKWIRAIPTLEGNHALLMDSDYKTRSDPLQKCAEAALDKGLHMFALQNGGQCFGGKTGDLRYNIYGPSSQCRGKNLFINYYML